MTFRAASLIVITYQNKPLVTRLAPPAPPVPPALRAPLSITASAQQEVTRIVIIIVIVIIILRRVTRIPPGQAGAVRVRGGVTHKHIRHT